MIRDSFVFYRSFSEALRQLDEKDFKEAVLAVWDYALDGTETQIYGDGKIVFPLIKPQIDANNRRYENGSKGGRPKTKTKPKQNQTITKTKPNKNQTRTKPEPNVNVNDNDNENDNENVHENVNAHENDNASSYKKRETQEQIFDRLIESQNIGFEMENVLREWLKYKGERRETYKETGMKNMISQVQNAVYRFGETAVMNRIKDAMGNGWKGMNLDKMEEQNTPARRMDNVSNMIDRWGIVSEEYERRKNDSS